MASYFLDSSSLVKRYAAELGTQWIRKIASPIVANALYIVRISAVEAAAALTRKVPSLPSNLLASAIFDFRQDLQGQYQILEVTDTPH